MPVETVDQMRARLRAREEAEASKPVVEFPKTWKGKAFPGHCRLRPAGHEAYKHPKERKRYVCRYCGEFMQPE